MFKQTIITTLCCIAVLSASMVIAVDNPLDNKVMYGIDQTDGTLIKHKFNDGSTSTVGVITDGNNHPYIGIKGAAFKPKGRHILAFWNDPADKLTKVLFVNPITAKGYVVGSNIGEGQVTGATSIIDPTTKDAQVFALQEAKYGVVDFEIDDGQVVPTESYAAKITVLGSAITYGANGYKLPVTLKAFIGNTTVEPFGSYSSPTAGNLNDTDAYVVNNKHVYNYIAPNTFPANTPIVIQAKSWKKISSSYSGSQDSHWKQHMAVKSNPATQQVKVLKNGDPVPNIAGFQNQANAEEFVKDYIDRDSNTMKLDNNQAIYLFEVGTTNMGYDAADFQDLVVLVTLAQSVDQLEGLSITETQPVAGLLNINPNNSGFNEFYVNNGSSTKVSRDSLSVKWPTIDSNGTYYQGNATKVHLKPKGNWGQTNSLKINGVSYIFKNTDAITLDGNLTVRVFNDKVRKIYGKYRAKGHWYITIGGAVTVQGTPDNKPASWLVSINTATGAATHIMDLHKIYDSLSAINNTQFYATFNNLLYLINTTDKTQKVLGTMDHSQNSASEFIGSEMFDFTTESNSLFKASTTNGATTSNLVGFGSMKLGSIVSVDVEADPKPYVAFD